MSQPITAQISDKHKLHGLDHLRALAIILVFLYHYQNTFGHPEWEQGQISKFGWTGVDLFFVLSGFLIAGQLFGTIAKGKAISFPDFFVKRFFRIVPPYLVIVLLYAFFPILREKEQFSALWKYLTFTLNFGLDQKTFGTFTHAWSLCVEEQFYFILPLIFLLFNYFKAGKRSVYLIAVLFAGCFIARFLSWKYLAVSNISTNDFHSRWTEYVYYPTYNRLDGLLIGVSIAGLYTYYPRVMDWANRRSHIILCAGLLTLVIAYLFCLIPDDYNRTMFGFPLVSLAYGLILAAFVCPSCIFYRLKSNLTSQIATLSYSIYLSHKLIIHIVQNLLVKGGIDKNSNLTMVICVACAIVGSLILRYTIEKPSLKIRDKVLGILKNRKMNSDSETQLPALTSLTK